MFSFKEQAEIGRAFAKGRKTQKDKEQTEKGLPPTVPLRQRVFRTFIGGLTKVTDLGVNALEKRRTGAPASSFTESVIERSPAPSRQSIPPIVGRDVGERGVELLIFDSEMRARIKDIIRSNEKIRLDLTGNVLRAVDQDGNRIPFSPSEAINTHGLLHHAFEKDR